MPVVNAKQIREYMKMATTVRFMNTSRHRDH